MYVFFIQFLRKLLIFVIFQRFLRDSQRKFPSIAIPYLYCCCFFKKEWSWPPCITALKKTTSETQVHVLRGMKRGGGGGTDRGTNDDTTIHEDEDQNSWKLKFALSSKECHDRGWITANSSFSDHEAKAIRAYIHKRLTEYMEMKYVWS